MRVFSYFSKAYFVAHARVRFVNGKQQYRTVAESSARKNYFFFHRLSLFFVSNTHAQAHTYIHSYVCQCCCITTRRSAGPLCIGIVCFPVKRINDVF